MTAEQLDLLTLPVTRGTHRHSDPASSVIAARATRPRKDQEDVYAALVANGGVGTLDTVCEALPHKLRNSLSRRLTDLESARRIRKTGEVVDGAYGQPVSVWAVVS
jgi:hypothetical protein